jgi:nitrile hydratase subunit alpha
MSADHHHPTDLAPVEARVAAIEAVLVEKGILDVDAVDLIVRTFEETLGPMNGAKVVARAWTDPAFKQRLLTDGTATIKALGFTGPEGDHIVVVENTPDVHNLVVCTLCSCYPWPLLGLPPNWYKSLAYRSRAVREPRTLLAEMGTVIDDDVEIRVWDSSAEERYLVLPMRPAGTEDMTEDQLAAIVTRDSMIGVRRL